MKISDISRGIIASAALVYMCRVGYFVYQDLTEKQTKKIEKKTEKLLHRATFEIPEEILIIEKLRLTPDAFYITSDGARLYSLMEDALVYFTGPDFNDMSEEEIGEWIAGVMSNLLFGEDN